MSLVDAAREARLRAHAPYSGFRVGAAVQSADGTVFHGCNVEISSYSHTCCAERVAVFKAVSEGHTELVACAVMTDVSPPATPCGACRQVLHDFGPDMVMLLANLDGECVEMPLKALLPDAFTPAQVLEKIKARHGGA
ncbi:MAG: cytidine deaminase [Proteobacteria bacterium]|nr:cytidine deaminase [Pseudomonadota bacterium]MCP4920397.1 cytidine deaminase [Pseudomonadota bacterium]